LKSTSTIELGFGYKRITPFPNLAVSVIETKDLKFSETSPSNSEIVDPSVSRTLPFV